MKALRSLVSGDRVRTKEGSYDLDLTYITDNVIAMSFPAEGIESVWRNSLNDVCQFLLKKHADAFMVLNLTERNYDYEKLNNQVHHAYIEQKKKKTMQYD